MGNTQDKNVAESKFTGIQDTGEVRDEDGYFSRFVVGSYLEHLKTPPKLGSRSSFILGSLV